MRSIVEIVDQIARLEATGNLDRNGFFDKGIQREVDTLYWVLGGDVALFYDEIQSRISAEIEKRQHE